MYHRQFEAFATANLWNSNSNNKDNDETNPVDRFLPCFSSIVKLVTAQYYSWPYLLTMDRGSAFTAATGLTTHRRIGWMGCARKDFVLTVQCRVVLLSPQEHEMIVY
jgi:hypothetical protein